MTKYYLHGGYLGVKSRGNQQLFLDVMSEIPRKDIQIIVIPFAREKSRWREKFQEISDRFSEVSGEKNISIFLGDEDGTILSEQIQKSDILFFWGGNTRMLQEKIETIEHFKELLRDKIVVGSSAGSLIFSEFYYENDSDSYHRGLSLLPFGMICHWKNQYEQLEYIKKYGGVDQVLCIPEGMFLKEEN